MPASVSDLSVRPLRCSELPVETEELARFLIGKTLVRETARGRMSGRIVETEAYVPGDPAGHAFIGRTARNNSLFLERGRAYVYFIYGNWYAINVSGDVEGVGAGVLLRALEPLEGVERMRMNRPGVADHALARGPGCLATALEIDRKLDGADLCKVGSVWLASSVRPAGKIGVSPRIGIRRNVHRPLRFFERNNPCVSGGKRLNAGIASTIHTNFTKRRIPMRVLKTAALSVLAVTTLSWAGPGHEHPTPVSSPEFQQVKKLVGVWKGTSSEMGQASQEAVAKYELTSGGQAVVEKLFAGTPDEMVSVYYDKGGKLAMTHYCMLPNRPVLELRKATANEIDLDLASDAGIPAREQHMHALSLVWDGPNKITQRWTGWKDGKPQDPTVITFSRVK